MSNLNQFLEAKNSLIRFYTSQQTSQSARLIGFTIALFTLLQTVQNSEREPLSGIFSELARHIGAIVSELGISEILVMHAWIGELSKLILVFIAIAGLMTWLIRTLFRFLVWAYFAQFVRNVSFGEIGNTKPIHQEIHNATLKLMRKKNKKGYWLFPLIWFIPTAEGSQTGKGWIRCILLATFSTLYLMWLIL